MANIDFSEIDSILDNMLGESENVTKVNVVSEPQKEQQATANKSNDEVKIVDINNDTLIKAAQDKVSKICSEMNSMFMEREDLVNLIMVSLISKTNLLMLGNPGTAKSQFTQEVCSRITGGKYFQWMLNKTSDPSEILGPFSVKEMENDKFKRITANKLPEANIVFLDEIYKCNSPVLNQLLTIMNEHIFYNDGKVFNVPLISLIGASNEPPEDDSLKALHDRFILRVNLEYVKDNANKKTMLQNYLLKRAGVPIGNTRTEITFDELELLQEKSKRITVPKNIISEFIKLIGSLSRNNIIISDRRQNEALKVLQSSAVLHGRDVVTLEDFKILTYVLWEKDGDIEFIDKQLSVIVNPSDDEINKIRADFDSIKSAIDDCTDSNARVQKAIESKNSITGLITKVNKIITKYTSIGHDTSKLYELRKEITDFENTTITQAINSMMPS